MMYPTIHNNGTAASDLYHGYLGAYRAVRETYKLVAQAYPNARDYYPQGNNATKQATDEHNARLDALDKIQSELEELCAYTMRDEN